MTLDQMTDTIMDICRPDSGVYTPSLAVAFTVPRGFWLTDHTCPCKLISVDCLQMLLHGRPERIVSRDGMRRRLQEEVDLAGQRITSPEATQ